MSEINTLNTLKKVEFDNVKTIFSVSENKNNSFGLKIKSRFFISNYFDILESINREKFIRLYLKYDDKNFIETIIDFDDFSFVKEYLWSLDKSNGYTISSELKSNNTYRYKKLYLHNLIFKYYNEIPYGFEIDHINRNRLDNRKTNLRLATRSQSSQNTTKRDGTTSKFKGVYFDKSRNKWKMQLSKDGKLLYNKRFDTELEAAIFYNQKAIEEFGKFANINIIN